MILPNTEYKVAIFPRCKLSVHVPKVCPFFIQRILRRVLAMKEEICGRKWTMD